MFNVLVRTFAVRKFLTTLVFGFFIAQGAIAQSVLFIGSGAWDRDAPATSFSAAAASWSFTFLLPTTVSANPTTAMTSFSYTLNGVATGIAPASVEFFSSSDSGMFDIHFQNAETVSFYGPIVLNGSSLVPGSYDAFSGLAGGVPIGSGVISLQAVPAVPEPGSWAMLALGLALLNYSLWRGLHGRAAIHR